MNLGELERRLSIKYSGETMDEMTVKHIVEDVKSVYTGLEHVEVVTDFKKQIKVKLKFKSDDEAMLFALQWL